MAKEVRWSLRADQERIDILDYWVNRNKSPTYSIKLANQFNEKIAKLAIHPDLGIATNQPYIKIKIVENYSVYYKIASDHIEIITIWDNRRNPKKLKL